MAKQSVHKFSTTAEWIKAGAMDTGLYHFSQSEVVRQSEKAIAVEGVGFTAYGNPCARMIWFPKSQVQTISEDFYDDSIGSSAYLIPRWLIERKRAEGLDALERIGAAA